MNLKKIIRESLDSDWSWTQFDPIEPRKKDDIRVGDVYTVYGRNNIIRYVLEIVEVTDKDVFYKMLVTSNEVGEPVDSIQSTELSHAKRLVVWDKHWVLTDSYDKGFELKESEEDDWGWTKTDPTLGELFDYGLINEGDKLWVKGYTKINDWDKDEDKVYLDGWFIIDYLGDDFTNVGYRTSKEICDVLNCGEVGQFLEIDRDLVVYKVEKEESALKESNDFDWIKDIGPDVESLIKMALSKSNNFKVETTYYGNKLHEIEIYASDGSGRYFGIQTSNTKNYFITYEDVLEKAKEELEYCYRENVPENITEEYKELYDLLKNP